ncbi:MAG: DUF4340 domain-containing protein [Anaerolineales bacterium]
MFKKDTLIVLLILAVVLAAYFLWKNWEPPQAETSEPTPTSGSYLLFTSDLGLLTSVRITDGRTTVRLERDPSGPWTVRLPRPGEADPARAGAVEIQVMSLRVLNQVEADLAPDVLGVDQPAYVIDLAFAGGTAYQLEVGRKTPTGSGYYVRVNGTDYIISASGIEALANLLTAPPYPATPTPEPATETPSPEETPPGETPTEEPPTPTATP